MTRTNFIGRIIGLIIIFLIGLAINYMALPAWNLRSPGLYFFLLVMGIIATIVFAIAEIEDAKTFTAIFGFATVAIIVAMIIFSALSGTMFNAEKYHNLITIENGDFSDVIKADSANLSIVDVSTAQKLGDRTIGGVKNSSWYDVDNEYNLIIYHGEQYRISAINYGGFFQYQKAKHFGIPGYVLVNCRNQEAKLVTLENPIHYSPSAFFSNNLKRHLRNQFPSFVFETSFFEIDEDGNSYWITAVKDATIGLWGGKIEDKFIITDACTGESKVYATDELPDWVDHAYDLDYLMQMIEYNMSLINGFWNFSHTGVNRTSYSYKSSGFAGYNTTVTTNGEVVFFTGVTPYNKAESILGFILANPRTGVVKYYPCNGAEESSAQGAAVSLVQNFGYTANYPTMVNVDGVPTYFMMLKDSAGLVQRYTLCNVENYTIVVEDTTLEKALKSYRTRLGSRGVEADEILSIVGTVQNVYTAEIDGYTYFYFTLNGDEGLYMSSISNSNRQVLLMVGSKVTFEYTESSEDGVYLVTKIEF